jgi:regulator of replication initiation timing
MTKYETCVGLMQQLLPLMIELAKEKNIQIAELQAEIERLTEENTTLLRENRDLRKANLSFAPVKIKQAKAIRDKDKEIERLKDLLSQWIKWSNTIPKMDTVVWHPEKTLKIETTQALKGGKNE